MKTSTLHFLFFCFVYLTSCTLWSQPGYLDYSFGNNGKFTYDFFGDSDEARAVVVQPDGKILVAGTANINYVYKFGILRLLPDGSLDDSFGTNGKVETQIGAFELSYGLCMALQPDGRIILAGVTFDGSNFISAVVRYMSDGQLDMSFGTNGLFTYSAVGATTAESIVLSNSGSIFLAGASGFLSTGAHLSVLKLNSNGTLDETFWKSRATNHACGYTKWSFEYCYSERW